MSQLYQLRRVGLPATFSTVQDIMILKNGVTTFGRNPLTNDYFLDSANMKNLISRNHADITVTGADFDRSYSLRDHSMNGTYVNDVRVKLSVTLQAGDVIKFGHINGADIKPGHYAVQNVSEFCFVFENVPVDGLSTIPDNITPTASDFNVAVSTNVKVECSSTAVDESNQSNVNTALMAVSAGNLQVSDSTVSSSQNSQEFEVDERTLQALNVLKSDGNTMKNSSQVTKKHSHIDTQRESNRSINPMIKSEFTSISSSDNDGLTSYGELNNHRWSLNETLRYDAAIGRRMANKNVELVKPLDLSANSRPSSLDDRESSQVFRFLGWSLPSRSDVPVSYNSLTGESQLTSSGRELTDSDREILNEVACINNELTSHDDEPDFSCGELTPAENTTSLPSTDNVFQNEKRKNSDCPAWVGKKRVCRPPRKLVPDENRPPRKRRKSQSSNAEAKATKPKSRRKLQVCSQETCSALDCRQPTMEPIDWVQCDDCDKWYHVDCVGCTLDQVRSETKQFHCGC